MISPKPIPNIDLKLNAKELLTGKNLLNNLANNNKKTICLFTYATGKRCYSKKWWQELHQQLLQDFPKYNFIEILPHRKYFQLVEGGS